MVWRNTTCEASALTPEHQNYTPDENYYKVAHAAGWGTGCTQVGIGGATLTGWNVDPLVLNAGDCYRVTLANGTVSVNENDVTCASYPMVLEVSWDGGDFELVPRVEDWNGKPHYYNGNAYTQVYWENGFGWHVAYDQVRSDSGSGVIGTYSGTVSGTPHVAEVRMPV